MRTNRPACKYALGVCNALGVCTCWTAMSCRAGDCFLSLSLSLDSFVQQMTDCVLHLSIVSVIVRPFSYRLFVVCTVMPTRVFMLKGDTKLNWRIHEAEVGRREERRKRAQTRVFLANLMLRQGISRTAMAGQHGCYYDICLLACAQTDINYIEIRARCASMTRSRLCVRVPSSAAQGRKVQRPE